MQKINIKYVILSVSMMFLVSLAFFTVNILSAGNIAKSKETPEPLYRAVRHGGKIGIFDADGDLKRIIDTAVSSLPEADREYLVKGIPLYTDEQLRSVIEDYSG